MANNLKAQAEEIDSGLPPLEDGELLAMPAEITQEDARSNYIAPKKVIDKVDAVAPQMERQVQGEFENFDPDLDRGIQSGDNQNDVRADNQGGWAELGRATVSAASEMALGALEGASLLLDFDMHAKAFQGVEQEFSNEFSRFFAEAKQKISEDYGKVYVHSDNEGFKPLSSEFWASNAASVASTVSLMVPVIGATKLLGAVAKASKIAKAARIGQKGQQVIGGLTSAVISRLGENAMEAAEAVESIKSELAGQVNPNTGRVFTEDEINVIAGRAGVGTWEKNWWMLATDFMQFKSAFKGIDYARRNATELAKKSLLKRSLGFAMDAGSEGFEEGFQNIASNESQHSAKYEGGIDDGTNFMERIAQYVTEDEFKTSVLLGAVGGAAFQGVGALTSYKGRQRAEKQRLAMQELRLKNAAAYSGDTQKFQKAEDSEFIANALQKASEGNLDTLEADLSDMYNQPDDELIADGVNPKEYRDKIDRARKIAKIVGKEYNNSMKYAKDGIQSAVTYARIAGKTADMRLQAVAESQEKLYEEDLKSYQAKDPDTAHELLRLAKVKNFGGSKEEVKRMAGEIAEKSTVFKNADEVLDAIDTPNSQEHQTLQAARKSIQNDQKVYKETEEMLKTKEGREKLKKIEERINKKRDARRKEAERKAKESAKEEEESSDSTDETGAKVDPSKQGREFEDAKREAAAEKFGYEDVGEPGNGKVFTTTSKRFGNRTWRVGETVKDHKGNLYQVIGRSGEFTANSVKLRRVDAEGNAANKGRQQEYINVTDIRPYSYETMKPGSDKWTVNVFKKQNLKRELEEHNKSVSEENDMANGIVKTTNAEFENWRRDEDGNWRFDGDPKPRTDSLFDIDFDLAAMPMDADSPREVELELIDSEVGPIIKVNYQGKTISKVSRSDRENQFNALQAYLSDNGGKMIATIDTKSANNRSNLGNVKGGKFKLTGFRNHPNSINGEVVIGSRTPDSSEIIFTSESGEILDPQVINIAGDPAKLAGNTFMLIKKPDGTYQHVLLNETPLGEIELEPGTTQADIVSEKIESVMSEIQSEIDTAIDEFMEDGMSEDAAVRKVHRVFMTDPATGKYSSSKSIVGKRFNEAMNGMLRMTKEKPIFDKKGKVKKNVPTKNLFDLQLAYRPEEVETDSGTIWRRAKVTPELRTSKEGKVINGEQTYVHATTIADMNTIREKIGGRFAWVSLDKLTSEGPHKKDKQSDRAAYVRQIVEEGWVTTDVTPQRPWVNPRLVISLPSEAANEMGAGKKVRKFKEVTYVKEFAHPDFKKDGKKKVAKSEADLDSGGKKMSFSSVTKKYSGNVNEKGKEAERKNAASKATKKTKKSSEKQVSDSASISDMIDEAVDAAKSGSYKVSEILGYPNEDTSDSETRVNTRISKYGEYEVQDFYEDYLSNFMEYEAFENILLELLSKKKYFESDADTLTRTSNVLFEAAKLSITEAFNSGKANKVATNKQNGVKFAVFDDSIASSGDAQPKPKKSKTKKKASKDGKSDKSATNNKGKSASKSKKSAIFGSLSPSVKGGNSSNRSVSNNDNSSSVDPDSILGNSVTDC